ncbi:MAG: DUF4129 domain-containing protein [Thaumarchaeota archaeon]|nr:DUF4129 domain-containing protein [Nitrososphaerota archaeon]
MRAALILVMILVFPLLVVAAYFATRQVLPEIGGLTFSLPQDGVQTASAQSLNSSGLQEASGQLFPSLKVLTSSSLSSINLVEVLLIVTLAVVVLIVWRGFGRRRGRTTPFEDDGDLLAERRRKMAAILDEAAARLNAGSSYRETVIECYRLISELLEERSEVDGKVLTAREFKKRVSEKLKIETPYLDQATELFEVARYSVQEITVEQAQQAAICLSNLSAPLKETVAPASDIR